MARMLVTLDGRSEAGGCPLVPATGRACLIRSIRSLWQSRRSARKRGKVEADHLEVALLEFVGGMYHDEGQRGLAQGFGAGCPGGAVPAGCR